jgi:hypothetical protein
MCLIEGSPLRHSKGTNFGVFEGRVVARSTDIIPTSNNCCPLIALPTGVPRSNTNAKRAFETVFKAMVDDLERSLRDKTRLRRLRAEAVAAL